MFWTLCIACLTRFESFGEASFLDTFRTPASRYAFASLPPEDFHEHLEDWEDGSPRGSGDLAEVAEDHAFQKMVVSSSF